jgi:5'-3' exonuclease
VIGKPDYEAEDVIASLAARVDAPIEVYSGDRDLFGIVRDPDLKVLYPEKGGLAEITEAEIERRYGIPGRRYADYAILRGDPSDGLPGLKGVGDKSAAALVRRFASVIDMVENAGLADPQREYLLRAARVVAPVTDLELPEAIAGLPARPADAATLEELSRELGVASSVSRLESALREGSA